MAAKGAQSDTNPLRTRSWLSGSGLRGDTWALLVRRYFST
jgi:hypothetical protein